MDILSLVNQQRTDGGLERLARNPLAQFGPRTRRLIGASLLPERTVSENGYREDMIRYRTVLANAGTRYSPVQKKKGVLVGSFDVVLFESDIGSELTSRDYDALLGLLRNGASLPAMAQLTRFVDTTVVQPMAEVLERWRWQAIVNAKVELRGDNGYAEDVAYSNPAGHRAAITDMFYDDAVDPFDAIFNRVELLASKGYTVSRIIGSRKVASIMGGNAKVQARTGRIRLNVAGSTVTASGRASLEAINASLSEDGLPPMELFDLQYRTQTGMGRFLPDDTLVFIGASGQDATLDLGDNRVEILPNTLGYTPIGRAAGQAGPGRVVKTRAITEEKPPRVEAEGWQTAGIVITEPEAIATLTGIVPAP